MVHTKTGASCHLEMHLLTLIFGLVLLPKVTTLKCYECVGSRTCTGTEQECPSEGFQCSAMGIASYVAGVKMAEVDIKSCVKPEQCNGGTLNFGITRTTVTSKCCTSNLCNIQPAPELNRTFTNGKKCFYCNGQMCTDTLDCEGNEDHCISAAVTVGGEGRTLKGCASSQMCSNVNNGNIKQTIGGEISCCQGDYCNGASSTSASILLLVAPLVPLVMIS